MPVKIVVWNGWGRYLRVGKLAFRFGSAIGFGHSTYFRNYPKNCFKFSDHFLRMTFPISDQVNDQVKAKTLIEHLKISLDGLGEINRAFVVAFKMPTEKQIAKYEKLAEQLTA